MKQKKYKEYQFNIKIVRACLQCLKNHKKLFKEIFNLILLKNVLLKLTNCNDLIR